jgi:pentatricopeptide repeat domain-containing protein 1
LNIYGTTMNGANPKASVDAVNSVIAAAGRVGKPDEAIRILNDMGKYGVVPNERTYRSVIVACNQAEHQKRRQEKRNNRRKGSLISNQKNKQTDNYDDHLDLQWWEAALSLFRRMKEENLTPDAQIYSSVISACESAGQWQRAIGILGAMMNGEDGQKPNLFCFNAAIAACEKGGAWLEAVELYERMRQDVRPNFITINSLLIALENANQKEMAESIYREALQDGTVQPWKWTSDGHSKKCQALVSYALSI